MPPLVVQLNPPPSVVVSASTSPVTARYLLEEAGEELRLLLAIISATTGRITQVLVAPDTIALSFQALLHISFIL